MLTISPRIVISQMVDRKKEIQGNSTGVSSRPGPRRESRFPARLFIAAVGVICTGLLVSAGFTFSTLLSLRRQYLANRGHEIALAIDAQARGMGRRSNPQFWQSLLDESYQTYADAVAFLALVDQSGRILAGNGEPGFARSDFSGPDSKGAYVFELPLVSPRMAFGGMGQQIQGWRLRVGIRTSIAESMRRQAWLHLAVAAIAAVALLMLSFFFLRMLQRFLELKNREGAERHLRALGTMAASLAHEIRNPLGAIKGLTQLAQEELPPDHRVQASMRTVVSEAERLESLVADLLSFARSRESRTRDFDLAGLLSDIRTMLQSRAEESGVNLQVRLNEDLAGVRSDPDGLRQILLNALFNALDATPRGGVVSLRAALQDHHQYLVVEIEDSGPGLGDRDPEELFQPFVTTKVRGTGLGLTISRQIAESLGGSLTLANRAEGGARCTIRLPLRTN
jgi:signal transduction histidine kinase